MISLKLIDNSLTRQEIELLMKWRKKVQPIWNETFNVTFKGTKKWITGINNNTKRRLFFIISDGSYIGHVGFEKKSRSSIYIDNVIRGEGRRNGEMSKAEVSLITIARFLYFKNIYVKTLESNVNAINFYTKLGFKKYKKIRVNYVLKYEKD